MADFDMRTMETRIGQVRGVIDAVKDIKQTEIAGIETRKREMKDASQVCAVGNGNGQSEEEEARRRLHAFIEENGQLGEYADLIRRELAENRTAMATIDELLVEMDK